MNRNLFRRVLLLPAFALSAVPASGADPVTVRGELHCSAERKLVSPYDGTVVRVETGVGQPVKKGDPVLLCRLSPQAIAAVAALLSEVPVKVAEAKHAAVLVQRKDTEAAFDEWKNGTLSDLGTRRRLEQLQEQLRLLEKKGEAAAAVLAMEQAKLRENRERLRELFDDPLDGEAVPAELALRAPMDGTVIWISSDVQPGRYLTPETPLLAVGRMDPMYIVAQVHEAEVAGLAVGEKAEIATLALPEIRTAGTVSRISWSAAPHHPLEPSYFEVLLSVPNPDHRLRQGYKATLTFSKP